MKLCQPHTPTPVDPTTLRKRAPRRLVALALAAAMLAGCMALPANTLAVAGTEPAAANPAASDSTSGTTSPSSQSKADASSSKPTSYEDQPLDSKMFKDTKGDEAKPAKSASKGGTVTRMIFGLLFVLGVIYGVYWLLRNYSKSRFPGMAASGGGAIEVVATTPLAANRALHLVRVGTEMVLIGATETSISQLSTVSGATLANVAGNVGNSEFQQSLNNALLRGNQPVPTQPPGMSTGGDSFLQKFITNLQMMTAR